MLYVIQWGDFPETTKERYIIMAYCKNCGTQLDDQATFCHSCGTAQNAAPVQNAYNPNQNVYNPVAPAPVDNGGFWWGALGCCVPIVGLILFLVWKDTKPKTAKSAGKGALISVILTVVFYIIYFILIGVLAATGAF